MSLSRKISLTIQLDMVADEHLRNEQIEEWVVNRLERPFIWAVQAKAMILSLKERKENAPNHDTGADEARSPD